MVLFSPGCASLTPPPGLGSSLRYTSHEIATPELARASPVNGARGAGGAIAFNPAEPARASNTRASQALFGAILNMSGSSRRIADELSRLKASKQGIAGRHASLFIPSVDYGIQQLRWIDAELAAVTRLSNIASEVDDPDMHLAILRMSGPRLDAAMLGSLLLGVCLDFLHLSDVVLQQCPYYSVEQLFLQIDRSRNMLDPALRALASLEPEQIEAAAADLPAMIGHLTGEFAATREGVRVAAERFEKALRVKELIEMLTTASVMKMALPQLLPPVTPATLGVGLVVGSNGVMMGTRLVVSAEWVEMVRQLVQAGVISIPVVSAAVRIHSGQVMMAHSNQDLPQGVRDALGDGPEVRGMRVTGKAGAGMAEPPQHHILSREFREWFEKRGFTGEMSIDQFCVRMEQAKHEAIHGGGNWRLGRTWPGEWNRMLMKALHDAEIDAGRMLTRGEILRLVAKNMRDYRIPVNFTPWRGR
jgi:hypothetical protein